MRKSAGRCNCARWLLALAALGGAAGARPVQGADVFVAIQPRWGQELLAVPSSAVQNQAGQRLRLTRLAALFSEFVFRRADGSAVRLAGQYGRCDAGGGMLGFWLHGVPEGGYVGLEFSVGVPAEANHADPGGWAPEHPLHPLRNGLHWSWQGGYVFAAVEGRWGPEEAERGFSYHLATDARRVGVRFDTDFSVGDATAIRLALNLARVIGEWRLDAADGSESTHSAADDPRADRLASGLARAWFWLGTEERAPVAAQANMAPAAEAREWAPGSPTPYAFTVPAGFPQPSLPADNPLTVEGIALGERLFAEPRLSGNGTQSCASCHSAVRAFSDGVALSRGAEGARGRRNAMPLFNLAWSPNFAWDGSQPRIRDQARAAWTNPIEMHGQPETAAVALARDDAWSGRFAAAFGSPAITPERIVLALEQFLLVQVSADSKFDRALRGEAALTPEEQRGFELFAREYDPARGQRGADCFHCHGGALFTDFALKNNGLDRVSADPGYAVVTGQAADAGRFKTPSLRNVAVTGPYLHDGRFATLEEVVAHYDHGVQRSPSLDPNLAKHPAAGLGLPADDQRALVAFLRTLTDARFAGPEATGGPAYSSPSQ